MLNKNKGVGQPTQKVGSPSATSGNSVWRPGCWKKVGKLSNYFPPCTNTSWRIPSGPRLFANSVILRAWSNSCDSVGRPIDLMIRSWSMSFSNTKIVNYSWPLFPVISNKSTEITKNNHKTFLHSRHPATSLSLTHSSKAYCMFAPYTLIRLRCSPFLNFMHIDMSPSLELG